MSEIKNDPFITQYDCQFEIKSEEEIARGFKNLNTLYDCNTTVVSAYIDNKISYVTNKFIEKQIELLNTHAPYITKYGKYVIDPDGLGLIVSAGSLITRTYCHEYGLAIDNDTYEEYIENVKNKIIHMELHYRATFHRDSLICDHEGKRCCDVRCKNTNNLIRTNDISNFITLNEFKHICDHRECAGITIYVHYASKIVKISNGWVNFNISFDRFKMHLLELMMFNTRASVPGLIVAVQKLRAVGIDAACCGLVLVTFAPVVTYFKLDHTSTNFHKVFMHCELVIAAVRELLAVRNPV